MYGLVHPLGQPVIRNKIVFSIFRSNSNFSILLSTSGKILSASVIARPQSGNAGHAKACLCIWLMSSKFLYPISERAFLIALLY